ncbi:unnamed protein product [Bemisia tabaci]|nr:unnamed protein product [Bemisia tabaci]
MLQEFTMATARSRPSIEKGSSNILMCRQWWKVCWIYGDQEKYYRQLYARRPSNQGAFSPPTSQPSAVLAVHQQELTLKESE